MVLHQPLELSFFFLLPLNTGRRSELTEYNFAKGLETGKNIKIYLFACCFRV